MARPSQRRSQIHDDGRIFELGVAGRKTGVTLPDTGVRDEHGMQPLEDLFSSPDKSTNGQLLDDDDEDSEEGMEMDIDYTGGVGPVALLKGNAARVQMPLPRSRSPPKTNLNSPPAKNPRLQSSSPARASPRAETASQRIQSVARKLDFGSAKMPKLTANVDSRHLSRYAQEDEEEEEEEEEGEDAEDDEAILGAGRPEELDESAVESIAMLNGADGHVDEEESENELPVLSKEPARAKSAAQRGRPSKAVASVEPRQRKQPSPPLQEPIDFADDVEDEVEEVEEVEEEPEEEPEPVQPKKRGRPKQAAAPVEEPEPRPRKRRSLPESAEEEPPRNAKRARADKPKAGKPGRPKAARPEAEPGSEPEAVPEAEPANAPKKRGRRPKAAADADTSLLPRGPPLPKSRGLAINRPVLDENDSRRTRSGRRSYKPLAFWRGEHVDYEYDFATVEQSKLGAYMPSIKEVVRAEEKVEPGTSKKYRRSKKASKPGRRRTRPTESEEDSDGEIPAEPWEKDPGGVSGEMVLWQPSHEVQPPAWDDEIEVVEQQVALSNTSIVPRTVRDSTFKYIKTVGLPFYGAGVLELPPGTEKKPKNSRKMFMTFFVQFGQVLVTVHETTFRITKGGMFFVPRGNYYTIVNDSDRTARLFFSQACEKAPDADDGDGDGDEPTRLS